MDQPLLPSSPPPLFPADGSPSFRLRLLLLLAVAAFSLWANHEASKGFQITVLSTAASSSPNARRFDLLFVANGRAARLVHSAADSVQLALYPDASFPRKRVDRVTLAMAPAVATDGGTVSVGRGRREGEFVVEVRPRVMEATDVGEAVGRALRRGMARVWLWDGRGRAPTRVLAALEDYLATSSPDALRVVSGSRSRNDSAAAGAEETSMYAARLNRAMKDDWNDRMLIEACACA